MKRTKSDLSYLQYGPSNEAFHQSLVHKIRKKSQNAKQKHPYNPISIPVPIFLSRGHNKVK